MTRPSVHVQIAPTSVPSMPSWLGEVAVLAHMLWHCGLQKAIEEHVQFARARMGDYGIDPLLGGTQTWKMSHWRYIKRDEKERKDMLYLYRLSIPYNHLFVKKNHLFCFLHVFQSQLDCNILKKNVFVSDYKTLRCNQR